MKVDFQKDFYSELIVINEKLSDLGFEAVDLGYLSMPDSLKSETDFDFFSITMSHEFLEYIDESDKRVIEPTNKAGYITVPWIEVKIAVKEKDLVRARKYILDILKKLGYEPFTDEDAIDSHFTPEKLDFEDIYKFSCYINPDYPKGCWFNHALG